MLLCYLYVFCVGACCGSSALLAADRIPEKRSIVKGRSHCTYCNHVLTWYELIPIISYVFCKGRCRYCGRKLSLIYPCMELAGGILACICFFRYGFTLQTITSFSVIMILTVISIIDFRTLLIYDKTLFLLAGAGLVHCMGKGNVQLLSVMQSALTVSVPMFLVNRLIKDAYGEGDIHLMAITGLFLLPAENILAALTGTLCAGVSALFLLMTGRVHKGAHIPFAPYLSIGIGMAMLYGNNIINWYIRTFLW